MKLGMNTHGRSSASDLFMTIAGSSVVVRWIGGLAHLDLTFAMDVMRMIGVVLPITPALAAGSIYNSADPQYSITKISMLLLLPYLYNKCAA